MIKCFPDISRQRGKFKQMPFFSDKGVTKNPNHVITTLLVHTLISFFLSSPCSLHIMAVCEGLQMCSGRLQIIYNVVYNPNTQYLSVCSTRAVSWTWTFVLHDRKISRIVWIQNLLSFSLHTEKSKWNFKTQY